ncbi:E3 ubiquitin-protein ligase RNF146-A-like isoform X2 [Battus philenor]|uniref:E3 ubiquitin-protein ligase RNF146-A-like isoform X2 n=1 Tax=Battus philenor TaxID=42288 RepID=UPI0035D12152
MAEQYCAVCLEKYDHPTKLPCGHIFCFLCAKGIAQLNKTCAMCRNVIPNDYFNNPDVISQEKNTEENCNQEYQWYYEGRNGWWKYNQASNCYLEETYNKGEKEGSLLIAGNLYHIDFERNVQVRVNDQRKTRKIRRETPLFPSKGIAGIVINNSINGEELQSDDHNDANDVTSIDEQNIPHANNSIGNSSDDSNDYEDSFNEMVRNLSVVTLREQESPNDIPETENA